LKYPVGFNKQWIDHHQQPNHGHIFHNCQRHLFPVATWWCLVHERNFIAKLTYRPLIFYHNLLHIIIKFCARRLGMINLFALDKLISITNLVNIYIYIYIYMAIYGFPRLNWCFFQSLINSLMERSQAG